MTPELAGQVCDRLDQSLRGSEINLAAVADTMVVILRDELWRRRRIRTGEIIECRSFLELLTSPPLKGFGEDVAKVEALLKDDAEALRLYRDATTAPPGHPINNNVMNKARQGNGRAYTLTRLKKANKALYDRVVAGELSANAAAVQAGIRTSKTPLDQLHHWWKKATIDERLEFLRGCRHDVD